MERNPVLQDLHTFHNPTTVATTTVSNPMMVNTSNSSLDYQNRMTMPFQQQANHLQFQHSRNMFSLNDTQTPSPQPNTSFLDTLDFNTNIDSRLFNNNQFYQLQQNQQQYLPVYQQNNNLNSNDQILLQRYNTNNVTNSQQQASYYTDYQLQSTPPTPQPPPNNAYYTSPQQHLQHLQNQFRQQQQQQQELLKKRKSIISINNDDDLHGQQKKKPKTKKKKTKVIDPNAPPKPKRKTGLNKPLILSPALSELMDGAKELSRPELVQKLWKYIKLHNLQDPADRRYILCDDQLKKVFDQDRINSFAMNKDLSAHLTKKEDDGTQPPPLEEDQQSIATKEDTVSVQEEISLSKDDQEKLEEVGDENDFLLNL